jgi:hypothetical protein
MTRWAAIPLAFALDNVLFGDRDHVRTGRHSLTKAA